MTNCIIADDTQSIPMNRPQKIRLSAFELTQIRKLKRPAYNSIITRPDGSTYRATVTHVVNVGKVVACTCTYQGKVGSLTVISPNKKVWVIPHRQDSVVADI